MRILFFLLCMLSVSAYGQGAAVRSIHGQATNVSVKSIGGTNSLTVDTNKLVVTSGGMVGIGTNNPQAALHVNGSGIIGSNLTVGGTFTVNTITATTFNTATQNVGTLNLTNPVSIASGGTGASLSDPNATSYIYWDDVAGSNRWASVATNVYASYAAGTAYTLTANSTNVLLGTSAATVTIAVAGTYAIHAGAGLYYAGATYVAEQTATFLLRRTNNTPATITSSTRTIRLPVLTTFTGGDSVMLPVVEYTATAGDIIQIYGNVSALPGAGSVQSDSAEIFCRRLR